MNNSLTIEVTKLNPIFNMSSTKNFKDLKPVLSEYKKERSHD
jgi:hypothetical protein